MKKPEIPSNELDRVHALHNLGVLDSMPEKRFDRITQVAKALFEVPIALISLVDFDRQWFKSKQGLDARETSREISFCGHAILCDGVFVVEDTATDKRFFDNPLVTQDPNIRFYAGCTIHAPDRSRIGTICLIDSEPRQFSQDDIQALEAIGHLVDTEIQSYSTTLTDELTRLANTRGLLELGTLTLTSAARRNQATSLALFDLTSSQDDGTSAQDAAARTVAKHFSKLLQDVFADAAVIARLGDTHYCALTIGKDKNAIQEQLNALSERWCHPEKSEPRSGLAWSVGLSSSNAGATKSIKAMVREASKVIFYEHALSTPS